MLHYQRDLEQHNSVTFFFPHDGDNPTRMSSSHADHYTYTTRNEWLEQVGEDCSLHLVDGHVTFKLNNTDDVT
jgi:hypothetical protein